GKLSLPAMHPALVKNFKLSYATLVALYEVIDGKTPRAGLAGVSKDDASQMAARLIDTAEDKRPDDLKKLMEWVKSNLTSFKLPV
ncbi:MAG TPA: hypothetical protein VG672_06365, partial [Bryobacteraceae bacterium]|nr:hypothetical protein [Bryobacteraceae bacterium]